MCCIELQLIGKTKCEMRKKDMVIKLMSDFYGFVIFFDITYLYLKISDHRVLKLYCRPTVIWSSGIT